LTVVTNGLRIASELAGCPGIAVVLPGGWVRWEALSVVGTIGSGVFDRINVQTAFVGAAGFTFETGLSDATEEEAQIKRSMIEVAHEVIAIVDHTKWERAAFATFCQTTDIDQVLTDDGAPASMIEAVTARGIAVRVAAVQGSPVGGTVPA
jgi:DeoR family transcriptional regulator of aga operon/DeoR family fructose operon transcriptional repressor